MNHVTPLKQLEIVGYADVLDEGYWPTVVPPVFRNKRDKERVLAPPFHLHGDAVYGGIWDTWERWNELVARNEMTAFETLVQAKSDYELWIGPDGSPRYEPRRKARKQLQDLSNHYVEQAREALQERRFHDVERLTQQAINANDGQTDALAIAATAYKAQGNFNAFNLMEHLAEPFCRRQSFEQMVEYYAKSMSTGNGAVGIMRDVAKHDRERATKVLFRREAA